MAPTYATIDGVQRELSAIPAMIDGVQRDLDFLFGTVDGAAREVFASVKHTWKKYEVVNVQKTEFTIVSGETLFYVWLGDSNTSTQSLLASSTTPTTFAICSGGVSCLNTSNKITVSYSDYDALETGIWISQLKTGIYSDYPASRVKSVDDRLNWSLSTPYYLVITCDQHAEVTTTTEETLVYIEDVAGRDADSYPENGFHTDGYWYVKQVELPDEYTQCAYIESSGTQCIDTGYAPNQDTKLEIDVDFLESNTGNDHHIASVNNSAQYYAIRAKSNLTGFACRYYTDALADVASSSLYGRHTFVRDQNKTSIDGGTETVSTYGTFQITGTLPLCCYKSAASGAKSGFAFLRIYSCQIYDNGTLARDFVPCMDANGNYGLYDLVGQAFYGNAGTGSFTGG